MSTVAPSVSRPPRVLAPSGKYHGQDPRGESQNESQRGRVIRHVRQSIADGTLEQGEVLPSAESLSQTLGVPARTVRRALDMLGEDGIIRSNGGRLRIVSGTVSKSQSSLMEHAVAVLAPNGDEASSQRRGGGWAEQITLGVQAKLQVAGLHSVVLHPDRIQGPDLQRLIADHPFGVVLTEMMTDPAHLQEVLSTLQNAGVPVAIYGDGGDFAAYDRIVSDHEEGAYQLTRWLIEQGRRHIVQIWPKSKSGYWFPRRREGYERAMNEAGLSPLPIAIVPSPPELHSAEEFEAATRVVCGHLVEYLTGSQPADAILLASDGHAPIAGAALRLFAKEPGRDVLLAGYDNYWNEMPASIYDPTVPSITMDKRNGLLGQELVRLLIDRVEGRLAAEPQRRLLAPKLFVVPNTDKVQHR